MFVMIINISNNENGVSFSVYIKSSFDDWRKNDGLGHDVTSIRLGYPPIYN